LNPIEAARAFQRLQEEFHLTQREIASKLGKSRETVANSVRLLDLPPYIQEALEKGQITESHGRFLLAIENPGAQKRLFDDIVLNKLTTRDVRERVRREKEPGDGFTHGDMLSPELKIMQERLSAELGTPVSIRKKGEEAGKIEISFFSNEELQNILQKFGTER
ncbi:MAG: ParB/RepB/Spo0J family partition protein, partial [Patescibacteria group bacterium]